VTETEETEAVMRDEGCLEFLWSFGSQENTIDNRSRKGMIKYWIAVHSETTD